MVLSFNGIAKNFRLMVVQVTKQIETTLKLLDAPDPRLISAIQSADDYVDTQKSMIENECFKFLGHRETDDHRLVDSVRALNVITSNLERIADLSVNISRQVQYLGDAAILRRFDYRMYFDALLEGFGLIDKALFARDSSLGLRICRLEGKLDGLYRTDLQRIMSELRSARDVERLVTVLFILHYLERMGDALLNVGEAIIFAALGERLKIHQYRVLDEVFSTTPGIEHSITDVELESIWGTRSGVRVGTAQDVGQDASHDKAPQKVLFKGGDPNKLQRERESLQRWNQVAPGLAPAVVEYEEKDSEAALLLEYLDGSTFQYITLNSPAPILRKALDRTTQTLRMLWLDTKTNRPVNGEYLPQLKARMDDVFRVHPYLNGRHVSIGSMHAPSFKELLGEAEEIGRSLDAPFSVLIHGDFNVDNIIYNHEADTLHFVDVHRSRDMDFVQDVSVFLVSNFRQPVFVTRIRAKLEIVSLEFLRFVRAFAAEQNDGTFDARLALGLARSFVTSTRFELNRDFTTAMYHRAILLLNKLVSHRGRPWEQFRVPDDVLLY